MRPGRDDARHEAANVRSQRGGRDGGREGSGCGEDPAGPGIGTLRAVLNSDARFCHNERRRACAFTFLHKDLRLKVIRGPRNALCLHRPRDDDARGLRGRRGRGRVHDVRP